MPLPKRSPANITASPFLLAPVQTHLGTMPSSVLMENFDRQRHGGQRAHQDKRDPGAFSLVSAEFSAEQQTNAYAERDPSSGDQK